MNRPRVFLSVLLLLPCIFAGAQDGRARTTSSLDLKGKVCSVKESAYLCYHFEISDVKIKHFEKTKLTGFKTYRFDTSGNLLSVRMFQETPFVNQYDSFRFDDRQRMVYHQWGVSDRPAGREEHTYNMIGKLTSVRQYDDTGGLFQETGYRYRKGLLVEATTYSRRNVVISKLKYTYDSLSRLVEEENEWNPYRYSIPYRKRYAYDAHGNQCRIRYESREKTWDYRRESDAAGRMLSEATYDARDSLLKKRVCTYDRRRRLSGEEVFDGRMYQHIQYRYARNGRLEYIRNRFGDTDFRTIFTVYDAQGNWTEKIDYDGINMQCTIREITYYQ